MVDIRQSTNVFSRLLNFTQGATGLLYYRADAWTAGNAIGSWNNVNTTACSGGLGRPGDESSFIRRADRFNGIGSWNPLEGHS